MNTFVDAPVVYSRVYNIYKTIMFIVIMVIVYSVLYCIHIAGLSNTGVYTITRPRENTMGFGVSLAYDYDLSSLESSSFWVGWG
jgi:hypothetical protein